MITMKHRIITLCSVILFLTVGAVAQEPTVTYDGSRLRITVPTGFLEFNRDDITNEAIRECFKWSNGSCTFMAQQDAYVFKTDALSTDEAMTIKGSFNGQPVELQVEMIPAATPVKPTTGGKDVQLDMNTLIIIGAAVLLVLLLIVILVLRKKKKVEVTPLAKNDPNIISVVNDESIHYEKGLRHVMERVNEYLVFDMNMVFADTMINKVYFSSTLIKKLYDFFNGSLESDGRTNETGCFILGCWDYEEGRRDRYDISLETMVEPGDDADFGEYSLNFGKKISINMASVIDNMAQKSKRDYVLTCWMHSHPGLGLFLSNQDLIVQQQLTYSDHRNRLLAIVIDTNTPDFKTGFFTAKADGKMNNKEEVKRWFSFEEIYRQSRELSRNKATMNNPEADFSAHPDNFSIALNDNAIDYIGFVAHVINQIDNSLYSGVKGVIGYFYGKTEGRYLQVDCCLPYENEEKLGCLVYSDNLTQSQLANYANDVAGCRFFINGTSDDKLVVWTKNNGGSFVPVGETTLSQMKEWIRRKRV